MEKIYLIGILTWLVVGFVFSYLMYKRYGQNPNPPRPNLTFREADVRNRWLLYGTVAGFLTLAVYFDKLHKEKTGIDMKETGITSSVRENLKKRGIL